MVGRRMRSAVADIARLTNAQWLAVSAFEDVVLLPERLADRPAGSAFGSGSPARYHVASAAPTLLSVIGSFATAERGSRRPRAVAVGGSVLAAALTAYLIRTVNLPLLRGTVPRRARRPLAVRWHRVNRVRLIVLLGVGVILELDALRGAARR